MAILGRVTTHNGSIFSDQYIKVGLVGVTKTEMTVDVEYYQDKDARDAGEFPYEVTAYRGPYDIAGDNPIAQGYALVKSLKYTDHQDV